MDFTQLTSEQFEMLCGRLIEAEGNKLESPAGKSRDIGVDYIFTDAAGATWVTEVKHFRRPRTATTVLRNASTQLNAVKALTGTGHGLLIVSILLPRDLKEEMEQQESIQVWDVRDLNRKLAARPDIQTKFETMISARLPEKSRTQPNVSVEPRAQELIERLEALPLGKAGWREYEDVCVEILNYAFFPKLGVPVIQSSSDDGLDRRDAVFPIASGDTFWDDIRDLSKTRFVVAEFKNYSENIGQREVESIQQYLFVKARRMFGLLCSRHPPSPSAVLARRRAWAEHDRLILFLSDADLKDLVRARSYDEQPSAVLDAQLNNFLIALNP